MHKTLKVRSDSHSGLLTPLLGGISKPRHVIGKLPFQQLLFLGQLLRPSFQGNLIAFRVLHPTPRRHEEREEERHATTC